jgi:hypothetical protein
MKELSDKASQTIKDIQDGKSWPRTTQSRRRGTSRLFAVLPQFGFATRYLPIDTEVLFSLLKISRREKEEDSQQVADARETVREKEDSQQVADARETFRANRAEEWCSVFRLGRLQGVKVPEMPVQEGKDKRRTEREFNFYMETVVWPVARHAQRYITHAMRVSASALRLALLGEWL